MRYGYPYQRQHGGQRQRDGDLPAPRPLTHLRPHFEHAAAAQPAQHNVAARLAPGDAHKRILRVRRSSPVDGEQQIPGPQARLQSGTAEVQLLDQNARLREPELPRLLLRHVLGDDSDPAADHPAVGDDLGEYPAHHVHGDREADALDPEVLGDDGGVDAHQRAARVDQRPSRVAEVDRSVGLDAVLEGRDAELLAAGCAHDPVSDGMSKPDRIPDREHHVPDQKLIRPADARHRELGEVDLQHREVGVGIATHDARVRLAPVLELHADRISVGDDMVIRDDVTALIHDDPGAEAALDALPVARHVFPEQLSERGGEPLGHEPRGVDVDHGGRGALHRGRIRDPLRRRQRTLGCRGGGLGRARRRAGEWLMAEHAVVAEDEVGLSRRKSLTRATIATGTVGAGFAAVPFIESWSPSESARAQGVPATLDLSKIEPGQMTTTIWRRSPIYVVRRTEEMIARISGHDALLKDPNSENSIQPPYAHNALRSRSSEFLVLVGTCTHLGCLPKQRFSAGELYPSWPGGFFCPCHGSRFDLAGRVFSGSPASTDLVVPPYQHW